MRRSILIVFVLKLIIMSASAQTVLSGIVKEMQNNSEVPLPFANVYVEGTTNGTTTDFDGNYNITIEPGTHTISFSFIGYEKVSKEIIADGETPIEISVTLSASGQNLKEVQVNGVANRESEAILMLEQKKATIIKESIGAKRLSSLGVSDAAAATAKITGVTKNEGSGDIYIRGLGDRYLSTTMNGLPIPSNDVEKKNIDLNLFSADVIKNVGISKTYDVRGYADMASGNVDISSKTLSKEISIGLASGSNSTVLADGVYNNFKVTQNYGDATLGFYKQPYVLKDAIKNQSWNTASRKTPIDFDFSILGGKKFKLAERTLSLFATLSHSGSSEFTKGIYKKYRANIKDQEFFDASINTTEINTTGLINLSLDLSPDNSINFNSLFVHTTVDELYEAGRDLNAYVFDQTPKETEAFVRDQNLKQTQLIINQLLGTHTLGEKHTLSWALGFNVVDAGEPNRIRNEGNTINNNTFEFAGVSDMHQRKSFQKISDYELNGNIVDGITLLDEGAKKLSFNLGANFRMKNRDFSSQAIGVRSRLIQVTSLDNLDEALLNSALYNNGSIIVKPQLYPDKYTGDLLIFAGFANTDFQIGKLSGNVGLRYEQNEIDVSFDVANYINPVSYQSRIGTSKKTYSNLLPSLNLKYDLNEKSAMRLAISKTVTLPEFKEIAPFEYVSPEGRVTKGNPDLIRSQNYNFDLKWEMYPRASELLSITGFYKKINDPINRAMTRGSSGNFFFANTGKQAKVYGLELDTRFDIIHAESTGSPELNVSVNATKMWFNQDLLENYQYNNKSETELQGAADLILNGALSFSNNKENAFNVTVSGNYSSDKIYALGAPEDKVNSATLFNNEIIEKGFVSVDLIVSKKISHRIALKLSGKNLLNPDINQTQFIEPQIGSEPDFDEIVRSYKKGIAVKLGVSIKLN